MKRKICLSFLEQSNMLQHEEGLINMRNSRNTLLFDLEAVTTQIGLIISESNEKRFVFKI